MSSQKQTDMSIAIQGFGNVGYYFAEAAVSNGHKIIAVENVIHDRNMKNIKARIIVEMANLWVILRLWKLKKI